MEKLNRTIIAVAIIAILLLLLFLQSMERRAWKNKAIIATGNYEAEVLNGLHEADGFTRTLKLTEEQFAQREDAYLDSLNELMDDKIELSRVLRLTQFRLSRKTQNTVEWRDSLVMGDTIRVGRIISSKDSCLSVSVFEPANSDSAFVSTFLSIKGSVIVYEGNRSKQAKLFGMNLFRYGKRITSAKMNTNCDEADVIIQDIEVIKQ